MYVVEHRVCSITTYIFEHLLYKSLLTLYIFDYTPPVCNVVRLPRTQPWVIFLQGRFIWWISIHCAAGRLR